MYYSSDELRLDSPSMFKRINRPTVKNVLRWLLVWVDDRKTHDPEIPNWILRESWAISSSDRTARDKVVIDAIDVYPCELGTSRQSGGNDLESSSWLVREPWITAPTLAPQTSLCSTEIKASPVACSEDYKYSLSYNTTLTSNVGECRVVNLLILVTLIICLTQVA